MYTAFTRLNAVPELAKHMRLTILKIGTLSVHVSAHGDCTVAKGFNQYSVACKNFKGLMFNS
jgi:hypothetical protein